MFYAAYKHTGTLVLPGQFVSQFTLFVPHSSPSGTAPPTAQVNSMELYLKVARLLVPTRERQSAGKATCHEVPESCAAAYRDLSLSTLYGGHERSATEWK